MQEKFLVGQAVRLPTSLIELASVAPAQRRFLLRASASLADQPRLRVAAFGICASPLCSPGTGESEA